MNTHPEVPPCADEQLTGRLSQSVFAPNAGYDGKPLAMLSTRFNCFVFADWNARTDAVREEMNHLKGYDLVNIAEVDLRTLIPSQWESAHSAIRCKPRHLGPFDDMPEDAFSIQWCLHVRWQRRPDFGPEHGREMLELYYFRGESTLVFEALYSRLGVNPAGICIIQPGGGLGSTVWTKLEEANGFFHELVKRTSEQMPEVLLHGGNGRYYAETPAPWPEYETTGKAARRFGEFHIRNHEHLPDDDGFQASVVEYRLSRRTHN
jgi:hypothetical protein